jgi:hypothetical protein
MVTTIGLPKPAYALAPARSSRNPAAAIGHIDATSYPSTTHYQVNC